MISRGTWEVNNAIPSINKLAQKTKVSVTTVRSVLKQFERAGIIECWGRLGFYLISDSTSKNKSRNQKFVQLIQTNLKAFELLRNNGIKKRNWILNYNLETEVISGLNEISGNSIETNLKEILDIESNLLSLSTILEINNSDEFQEAKKKFDRQRELLPLARVVLTSRKELGING
jgi:DNA-binding transcriptional regulator YhcF (GntR family)